MHYAKIQFDLYALCNTQFDLFELCNTQFDLYALCNTQCQSGLVKVVGTMLPHCLKLIEGIIIPKD